MEEEQRHLEILQQQLLHEQAMLLVSVHSSPLQLWFSLLLLIPLSLPNDALNDPLMMSQLLRILNLITSLLYIRYTHSTDYVFLSHPRFGN